MATIRQRKAARLVAAHIKKGAGKTPHMKELLKDAGYGKTASTTVVGGKGFQESLKQFFPDDFLNNIHKDSVLAAEHSRTEFPKKMSDAQIKKIVNATPGAKLIFIDRSGLFPTAYYTKPEHRSRLTALDMMYKMQTKYPPDKIDLNTDNYANMTDEEIEQKRKEISEQLQKVYERRKSSPRAKKT